MRAKIKSIKQQQASSSNHMINEDHLNKLDIVNPNLSLKISDCPDKSRMKQLFKMNKFKIK